MKRAHTLPHLWALGAILVAALVSCGKDHGLLPDGAIVLTTEGHQSPSKTSVSANTVQWTGGDIVWFYVGDFPFDCPVVVSGSTAYVEDNTFPDDDNTIRAYYPSEICDMDDSRVDNLGTDAPTVVIPNSYTCRYDEQGRQVLHLPLAATAPPGADRIEFKHLTAAVKVVIRNISVYDLTLDRVVVSSSAWQLSGAMTLDLTSGGFGITPQPTSDFNSVTVRFADEPFLAQGRGEAEVQVPIRPIGSGALRIEVFAHGSRPAAADPDVPAVDQTVICHFSHANNVSNLDRNVMITAPIALVPRDNTYPNSHTAVDFYDNSLFTINSSGTQVRFTKGNLTESASGAWGFHDHQYDFFQTQTDTERDLFPQDIAGERNSGVYRVLTSQEWEFVLNSDSRTTTRYAKARLTLAGETYVNGLILFPDAYVQPRGIPLQNVNAPNLGTGTTVPYSDFNSYTLEQWGQMERAGAVFLPAALGSGGEGRYWTPGASDGTSGQRLYFNNHQLSTSQSELSTNSCSVRLAKIMN